MIVLHNVAIRPAPKLNDFKQMNRDFPCCNTEVCEVLNGYKPTLMVRVTPVFVSRVSRNTSVEVQVLYLMTQTLSPLLRLVD